MPLLTDVDSGDVSRSGRVRKRSSKLADYDPQDELDVKPPRKERRDSGQYSKRKTKVRRQTEAWSPERLG